MEFIESSLHRVKARGPSSPFLSTVLLLLAAVLPVPSCGHGRDATSPSPAVTGNEGDPSPAPGEGITLLSITFPEGAGLAGGGTAPPGRAPLSQEIVFTFSGPVKGPIPEGAIRIQAVPGPEYRGPRAALDETRNLVTARGTFEARGNLVIFHPFLPKGPVDLSLGADPDCVPGLLPGMTYAVFVPVGTKAAISNLRGLSPGVQNPTTFTTLPRGNLSPAFLNYPAVPPRVVSVDPPDGTQDFPVNTFDTLPGFPENRDILLDFDQPLDPSPENLEGTDLDGDGAADATFFLGYRAPRLFCAVEGTTAHDGYIATLHRETDTFELLGFTRYQGADVSLHSILFRRAASGEPPFPMVGCTGKALYDVDYTHPSGNPSVCTLANERLLDGGADVAGLAVDRKGTVYGLDRPSQVLLTVNLETGHVEPLGTLPPGPGDFWDLCAGPDDRVYGLRVFAPGTPSASCSIERIQVKKLETSTVVAGLKGDYTTMTFSGDHMVVLYDTAALRRVVVDLSTGAVTEFGTPVNDPSLQAGDGLDFDLQAFELGVKPVLVKNNYAGARVRLEPSGVLPFGAWIEVMVRNTLRNISGGSAHTCWKKKALGARAAARYRTFDPGPGTVSDRFVELFLDNEHEDEDHPFGEARALWNVTNPGYGAPKYAHLLAALGSAGAGELGDFTPTGTVSEILLDTDCQNFPLLDGSTPDITQPVTVYGGEFHFHDIKIPEGVTVRAVGANPLVLTATGHVEIAGTLDLSGTEGTDDTSFNVGYLPVPGGPGGPGGGRGGAGQPTLPPDFKQLKDLVSPTRGERGRGPGDLEACGGEGGESGAQGPDVPWKHWDPDKKSRGAGGGGGSFFQEGGEGYIGKGQYGVDEEGNYVLRDPYSWWDGSYEYDPDWQPGDPYPPKINEWTDTTAPHAGAPGAAVFTDGDPENDFIGPGGELDALVGGQGGGGGGSRLDSMNPEAQAWAAQQQPPLSPSAADARGGGGGGGGGAVAIHAMGEIVIRKTGRILARGGGGGGGETIGNSTFGGGGGGGSGGAVILDSATRVEIEFENADLYGQIDVSGGWGGDASQNVTPGYSTVDEPCAIDPHSGKLEHTYYCTYSRGDGGYGGYGLIQLMVPDPSDPNQLLFHDESIAATVVQVDGEPNFPKSNGTKGFSYYHFYVAGFQNHYYPVFPTTTECLVPPEKTPSLIQSRSYARSTWIDTGAAGLRPDVGGVHPPVFSAFEGIGPAGDWGVVLTTPDGHVINSEIPDFNDIEVDAPDLALEDFIPPDNEVAIQFQGTDALFPGAAVPDENPAVMSPWTWDLASLSGRRFIRFRVRLDTAKGGEVQPDSTKPQVNKVRLRMKY